MNKAFTLIELLAVIAILGIILLIAIPAVTNTISNAAKNVFISSAKEVVEQAKMYIMDNDISLPSGNYYVSIPISSLDFDNKSSYNTTGGVIVINNGTVDDPDYEYFVYLSNSDYVINGAIKSSIKAYTVSVGTSAPYLVVPVPSSGTVLVNTTLGITGHALNVTTPSATYISYSLY